MERTLQPLEHRPDDQSTGLTMNKKLLSSAFLLVLIGIVSVVPVSLFANNNLDRLLSREAAAEDIELYFSIIDQQHGNPYQYISRKEFRQLVDETIARLPESIPYKEFDVLLTQLNNKIRCGHTVVSLDTDFLKSATNLAQFFPYPVRIIEGRYFIDFEDGDLPLGSELISINEQAISSNSVHLR